MQGRVTTSKLLALQLAHDVTFNYQGKANATLNVEFDLKSVIFVLL